jgi:hypothetical protein
MTEFSEKKQCVTPTLDPNPTPQGVWAPGVLECRENKHQGAIGLVARNAVNSHGPSAEQQASTALTDLQAEPPPCPLL